MHDSRSEEQDWLELLHPQAFEADISTSVPMSSNSMAFSYQDWTQQNNSSIMHDQDSALSSHQLHAMDVAGASPADITGVSLASTQENVTSGFCGQLDLTLRDFNGKRKRGIETQEELAVLEYPELFHDSRITGIHQQSLPQHYLEWSNHSGSVRGDLDSNNEFYRGTSLPGSINLAMSDSTMAPISPDHPRSVLYADRSETYASRNLGTPRGIRADLSHNIQIPQAALQTTTYRSEKPVPATLGNLAGVSAYLHTATLEDLDDISTFPVQNSYNSYPPLSTYYSNPDLPGWNPPTTATELEDQSVDLNSLVLPAAPSHTIPSGQNTESIRISTNNITGAATSACSAPSHVNGVDPHHFPSTFENSDDPLHYQSFHDGSYGYTPEGGTCNTMNIYAPSPSFTDACSQILPNSNGTSAANHLSSIDQGSANLSTTRLLLSQQQHHIVQQKVIPRKKNRTASRKAKAKSSAPSSTEQQLSIPHRLHKEKGVPEGSAFIMQLACSGQNSRTDFGNKRRRTGDQRRNKREVEQIGGSCMMCRYHRKKVAIFVVRFRPTLANELASVPVRGHATSVETTGSAG
jgi:hypothetical protein